jgi:type II secretory pathway component GspD/PulD (secretin)
MKSEYGSSLLASALAGLSMLSLATAGPAERTQGRSTGDRLNAGAQADRGPLALGSELPAPPPPPANQITLRFRGAPINLVLDYLSDAAGFIINQQAEVTGAIDMWSSTPVSRDEAADLLNTALKKSGCAVIRHGRILTVVRLDAAKTADLDVIVGSDPAKVDRSDEVVTQIIPVRHANVTQLLNNLQVLLPASASLSANESANTLILVAAKADIRRMLKIISALDAAIASVSSIKVIPLRYADAKQLAAIIQQLFASQDSGQSGGGNRRGQMFNMPFGPPGMGGPLGGASNTGSSNTGANAAGAKVVAVADDTSNSLVVSAPADLMAIVTNMVEQIDQPVADVTELRLFHLRNADPTELADQLSRLFPDDSAKTSSQNQAMFRFGGPPGFGGNSSQDQTSQTSRTKKRGQLTAVADARTSTLLVSAASTLMPQIAKMIEQLDSSSARKQIVQVFELRNADPSDVNQVLQDLFNRNNTMRNTSASSQNSQLGNNNALDSRQTQQQNQNSRGSAFGNSARSGGAGGSGGF